MKLKKNKYNKIYHLSHIDLDGYGCQYMTKFLQSEYTDIEYFNADYIDVEKEIGNVFSLIVQRTADIKSYNETSLLMRQEYPNILFLITDVSLNEKLEEKINNFLKSNKHIKLDVRVLDHHKSGKEIAERNGWYTFNNDKCGSSLTAAFVNTLHENKELAEHLTFVGEFIESHDIWKEDSKHFNFSNYLSDVIFNLYFPEFLKDKKREFLFIYIYNFMTVYNSNEVQTVQDLEIRISFILKETLSFFIKDKTVLEDENVRSLYKLYYYYAEEYSKNKDQFETLVINGLKFKVLYNTDGGFFQYFSHYVLEHNKEIDFLMRVSPKGKCSFRSVNEDADVDLIANLLSNGNGGGHKHASGCSLTFTNSVHSYNEVIKELLLIDKVGKL